VEHKDKDQATGMEIAESFITCGQKACKTHKKIIAAFIQNDDKVEVARGQVMDKGSDMDMTRLESGMSFLQVKKKLWQVQSPI
jgi:hypothetical protein